MGSVGKSLQEIKCSEEQITIVNFSEEEKEKELVTLIAKIIVDKIFQRAGEKGHTIPEI
jgi:hypothetical protein